MTKLVDIVAGFLCVHFGVKFGAQIEKDTTLVIYDQISYLLGEFLLL